MRNTAVDGRLKVLTEVMQGIRIIKFMYLTKLMNFVSENDSFCIKQDEFCIYKDEFCMQELGGELLRPHRGAAEGGGLC